MAEFIANDVQLIQPNTAIPLNLSIGCSRRNVYHRAGAGIVTLRGNTQNCFARYQVTFNGNIAVPTGGTVQAIAIAITISGESIPTSRAIVTPAAVDEYFNVTSTAIIDVPAGCCYNISVDNVAAGDDPAVPINVQNSNLVISRIA